MTITVDGISYNVTIPVGGLRRSFQVLDGENAGRTLSGKMFRDIIGTFYNYELQLEPVKQQLVQYDALYQVLSDPTKDSHTIILPYGQETLTFNAYVTSGQDALSRISGGKNYWNGLTLQFIAMEPQRKKA